MEITSNVVVDRGFQVWRPFIFIFWRSPQNPKKIMKFRTKDLSFYFEKSKNKEKKEIKKWKKKKFGKKWR